MEQLLNHRNEIYKFFVCNVSGNIFVLSSDTMVTEVEHGDIPINLIKDGSRYSP